MARCKRPWHSIKWRATSCGGSLQTQLRGSPVSSLGVVPDLTISFHSNSLGNGKTLLLFFGLESLDSESLMRRHSEEQTQALTGWWGRGESPSVCQEGWKPTNPELLLQLHGVLYHIQNSPQRPRPSRAPLTMRTTVLWPFLKLALERHLKSSIPLAQLSHFFLILSILEASIRISMEMIPRPLSHIQQVFQIELTQNTYLT